MVFLGTIWSQVLLLAADFEACFMALVPFNDGRKTPAPFVKGIGARKELRSNGTLVDVYIYIYMCVCVYVYIYMYNYIYIYISIYVCMYIYIYT